MSLAKTGFDFSLMTDFVEGQYREEQWKAQTDDNDTATDDNGSNT